ncbi:sensor histidine kinase [Pararcticibacter amylolyticus]|uniref:Signal transduction histidine kinase internal region domain-containing protein n=1 Tax=Pararcticibacter amylolyticus TaxID=2173175 RepID=A0A2U2PIV3_9SPHI|nr:histidine kinase [Pararcticibacter amylolyticus]PWG81089.1 hypothetical protein DDR33_09185 [Pararcticibacter amylolyticus]
MNRIKLQNLVHEAIPLLLWLGFVLFPFLFRSPSVPSSVHKHFLEAIFINNLVLLSVFYLHAFAIYPLKKGRNGILWYIAALLVCLIAFVSVSSRLNPEPRMTGWGNVHKFHQRERFPNPLPPRHPLEKIIFAGSNPLREFRIVPFFFVILCSYCYRILRDHAKRERALKEHENEHLKTELNFLRSQISPHFMFNVMNSMVSLARKQSPLLETSLINMSSLMRYMLYETGDKQVSLNTEIEYLKNYIDLQLLRYGDSVKLNLYINGHTQGYHIEPMLLIPFVENAFKHGISMIEAPLIDISLAVDANTHWLNFNVVNSISPQKDKSDNGIGIGLVNVQRRLALLYPEKHTLSIGRDNNIFNIKLKIKLT